MFPTHAYGIKRLSLFTITTLLNITHPAFSQWGKFPDSDDYLVNIEHIPSPNYGRTNSILRDHRGFLWSGTSRGLCKYDGYVVREMPTGLPQDDLQQVTSAIMHLSDSLLLLATGRGLWTFDLHTEQFRQFLSDKEFANEWITAILLDSSSPGDNAWERLWVGTAFHGLFRYDRATHSVTRYTTVEGLTNNYITTLYLDRSERLWIGTGGGLNVMDPQSRIGPFRAQPAYGEASWSGHITALQERNGELWIGTTEGLAVLDLTTLAARRMELHSHMEHTIWSMAHTTTPVDNMWLGVSDVGLILHNNGGFSRFSTPAEQMFATHLSVLYPDPSMSDGTRLLLWVGTRTGVTKVLISRNPFTAHIRNKHGLVLDRGAVLSLCEDRKGVLWVGLWGGGLEALQPSHGRYKRIRHIEHSPDDPASLPHNDVWKILEDRQGVLWIATHRGILTLDSQRNYGTTYRHNPGDSTTLLTERSTRIYEDRSGTIWVGSAAGLSRLNTDRRHFTHFLHHPPDGHPRGRNEVSDILEDKDSVIWAATYGRGLNRMRPDGSFARFLDSNDSSGVRENWIYRVIEDPGGRFWLSTAAGLSSFDPEAGMFIRYPVAELRNVLIFDLFPDNRENLWLSTTSGLFRFNPKTQSVVRYNETHGLPFQELRSGLFCNASGKVFVGGLDGFAEFFPDSVIVSSHPPEVVITSFSVFDRQLPTSSFFRGVLALPHDHNAITMTFAALDYVNPLHNAFAYRMEGVDRDWVNAGTRNYVVYANLDHGDYVFRVKGRTSEGIWNNTETTLLLSITPPFWKTWWFSILLTSILCGSLYAVYRYRLHKILEVERLRLRIADDLHDDVGSNISTIAMVSRAIQRAPELSQETRRKLDDVYNTAISISEGMRDIVWFIKPENDTLDDLLLRMKDAAAGLLANTAYEFHTPKDLSPKKITVDFKRNFFLAFKEIVTNIVKHAGAGHVRIEVEQRDDHLELIVQDNGRGFDESAIRGGNGIASLRTRAAALNGRCTIAAQPGAGTTIKFSANL